MYKLKHEKDYQTFDKWWEENKTVYERIGVDRELAGTIWTAAICAVEKCLMIELKADYLIKLDKGKTRNNY